MFILNTLSNYIIKNLSEILDIKLYDLENKKNIYNILEFLKHQKESDIEEFEIILKQVNPIYNNTNLNKSDNNIEIEKKQYFWCSCYNKKRK